MLRILALISRKKGKPLKDLQIKSRNIFKKDNHSSTVVLTREARMDVGRLSRLVPYSRRDIMAT